MTSIEALLAARHALEADLARAGVKMPTEKALDCVRRAIDELSSRADFSQAANARLSRTLPLPWAPSPRARENSYATIAYELLAQQDAPVPQAVILAHIRRHRNPDLKSSTLSVSLSQHSGFRSTEVRGVPAWELSVPSYPPYSGELSRTDVEGRTLAGVQAIESASTPFANVGAATETGRPNVDIERASSTGEMSPRQGAHLRTGSNPLESTMLASVAASDQPAWDADRRSDDHRSRPRRRFRITRADAT